MNKKTVRDIEWNGKRALVRVDFNVPQDSEGSVTDDTRIRAALPTIRYLLEQGANGVVLMSHLGRPKGKVNAKYSMRPVVERLFELLPEAHEVRKTEVTTGEAAEAAAAALQPGTVLMLENTRFDPREEANDAGMSAELARLGDVFVNDAFGAAHRANASTEGVAHHLPAVAGFLMEKELEYIGGALEQPKRPFVTIIGGAKISDKIGVIDNLLGKVDALLIGGGMANTFLLAEGKEMGDSLIEPESVETARTLIAKAKAANVRLLLPVDAVIADAFSAEANTKVVSVDAIPAGWRMLDIGPETTKQYRSEVAAAQLVIWNGPMGVFELDPFASGTRAIASAMAEAAAGGAITIVGGGDSVAAVEQAGLAAQMSHVSTGGGASLELLEGKKLPGVAALQDR
ncbi:phosphoglycerate kinase [Candidatus Chloroploca asiatica]|uniref:Phosphoglycerate kinase n=1 Tax=Candidatus Chloroploca asiatica TaxID=1506545 RepID=A0A2H3KPL7_9CHLR|nr:phosphoglycerate kinase [Candidatus Chloroploca asiatica]PDW00212.1 phosphoglycerate kinase [Candidatus Chloroploca asiatica]